MTHFSGPKKEEMLCSLEMLHIMSTAARALIRLWGGKVVISDSFSDSGHLMLTATFRGIYYSRIRGKKCYQILLWLSRKQHSVILSAFDQLST